MSKNPKISVMSYVNGTKSSTKSSSGGYKAAKWGAQAGLKVQGLRHLLASFDLERVLPAKLYIGIVEIKLD